MKLLLLTPEWNREVEVDAVFLPGSAGAFEVLKDHAPLISTLDPGLLRWRCADVEDSLEIKGGAVRVYGNAIEACIEL